MNQLLKLVKNENGSMVGMILMALVFFLFTAALVVDVGVLYLTKIQLQNAADAGALAGAMELGQTVSSDPVGTAESYAEANDTTGRTTAAATVSAPTITVVCTKTVPYFFARLFPGFSNQEVSARAVARLVYDGGKALPFVNLQDDYRDHSLIQLWEVQEPGSFERVHESDYIITNHRSSGVYFEINYLDGLRIRNGVDNTIKQDVQTVFDKHEPYVYLLSLSSDVIRSGVVTMNDGSKRALSSKNKLYPFIGTDSSIIIARDQLVLLKCTFNVYDSSPHEAVLTFIEEYDIGNGVFPPNHLTARLVE